MLNLLTAAMPGTFDETPQNTSKQSCDALHPSACFFTSVMFRNCPRDCGDELACPSKPFPLLRSNSSVTLNGVVDRAVNSLTTVMVKRFGRLLPLFSTRRSVLGAVAFAGVVLSFDRSAYSTSINIWNPLMCVVCGAVAVQLTSITSVASSPWMPRFLT